MSRSTIAIFHYNDHLFDCLTRTISKDRLRRYLAAGHQDMANALWLYEANIELSEAIYGIIQTVEVAVRNAFHHELTLRYQSEEWYERAPLPPYLAQKIVEAKRKVGRKRASPGQIIAELSFGFWVDLIAQQNDQSFWIPCLHRAFPCATNLHPQRATIHRRLENIRWLRNRIAHHEPILTSRTTLYTGHSGHLSLDEIDECVTWICPDTALWIKAKSRFSAARGILTNLAESGIQL